MSAVKTIYFGRSAFHFSDRWPEEASAVYLIGPQERLTPAKLVEIIGNNNSLWIVGSNAEDAFGRFVAQMKTVDAGGGIVEDEEGRVLMILRHGIWDLPKGHVEQGETNEQAALREVAEETGLAELDLGSLVAVTEHFHHAYGEWEVKRTWWYGMHASSRQELHPQAEEAITRAEWLSPTECRRAAAGSFATIMDVTEQFFRMPRR